MFKLFMAFWKVQKAIMDSVGFGSPVAIRITAACDGKLKIALGHQLNGD
jgi:hypothetical protein